jgi:hypothetical protein
MIGVTLGLAFFMGATPFIDNSGNVAGLVAGFLTTVGFLLVQHKVGFAEFSSPSVTF